MTAIPKWYLSIKIKSLTDHHRNLLVRHNVSLDAEEKAYSLYETMRDRRLEEEAQIQEIAMQLRELQG